MEEEKHNTSSLHQFDNKWTYKNTLHSYFDTYDDLFKSRRDVENVLEVGVREGGSMRMWCGYFEKAHVTGVEINENVINHDVLKGYEGRYTIKIGDAYNKEFIETFQNQKFDIIIDDGSHEYLHVVEFMKNYIDLLTPDGILIIEGIQNILLCDLLTEIVPECYKSYVKIIDLHSVKGRYDDVLFVIDKQM